MGSGNTGCGNTLTNCCPAWIPLGTLTEMVWPDMALLLGSLAAVREATRMMTVLVRGAGFPECGAAEERRETSERNNGECARECVYMYTCVSKGLRQRGHGGVEDEGEPKAGAMH